MIHVLTIVETISFIVLPIELPIELPIVLPIVLRIGLPTGQWVWAGPAWVWLGGPRVLGLACLVLNTLKNHDSDEDVNIIRRRTMTVISI